MKRELKEIKKLYLPALSGEKKHVVDVDIPFEKPEKAELIIDTENLTPAEIAKNNRRIKFIIMKYNK